MRARDSLRFVPSSEERPCGEAGCGGFATTARSRKFRRESVREFRRKTIISCICMTWNIIVVQIGRMGERYEITNNPKNGYCFLKIP